MVCSYQELPTQQVVAIFPSESYECKEFFPGGTVISFGRGQTKVAIRYHLFLPLLELEELGPNGCVRCICVQNEHIITIGVSQDWGRHQGTLESFKGFLVGGIPVKSGFGTRELVEGTSQLCIVLDMVSIVISKPQKGLNLLATGGRWPLCDGLNFLRINPYPFGCGQFPQERHFLLEEHAFSGL